MNIRERAELGMLKHANHRETIKHLEAKNAKLRARIAELESGAAPERSGKLADELWRYGFKDEHFGLMPNGPYVLYEQVFKTDVELAKAPITKEWCIKMAALEDGCDSFDAGRPAPKADNSSAAPSEVSNYAYVSGEQQAEYEKEIETFLGGKNTAMPVAAPASTGESLSKLPPPELTWLYTHCKAIGMTCVSDSGKWEHDIALFTINLKEELRAALATPRQTEDGGLSVGARLHREDIASRLQGAMNAAPGSDSAEVSKLTLTQAIAALASTFAPKEPAAQGGVPEGLMFDGYHDSDEHYGKTILELVGSRLEIDPDDLTEGDTFYVSACWVQPQEWRVVRSGNPFEVERVLPAAPTGASK